MKKLVIILLSVVMIIGISACNNTATLKESNKISNDNSNETDVITEEEVKEIEESEEEVEEEVVEEVTDSTPYDKIAQYMKDECEKAFSPYYDLLDFEISNYKEEVVDGNIEATFYYKLVYKNYDKDPDTVGYIKEAKEKGSENYQQMYDEYLEPKEMNFDLKVIIDQNGITLYSNVSPKGIECAQWDKGSDLLSHSQFKIQNLCGQVTHYGYFNCLISLS